MDICSGSLRVGGSKLTIGPIEQLDLRADRCGAVARVIDVNHTRTHWKAIDRVVVVVPVRRAARARQERTQ